VHCYRGRKRPRRAGHPRAEQALRPDGYGSGDARVVGAGYAALGTPQPTDLKVLFTSGYADLSRFGDKLRNHPVLRKPFKPEALAEAVQTALHGVYSDEPHNVVLLQRDRR